MVKRKRTPKKLPELYALLICERALLDEDKSASLIRVIDTFTLQHLGELPLKGVELTPMLTMTVYTRWGNAVGDFTHELRIVTPSGGNLGGRKVQFSLKGDFPFHQVRWNLQVAVPGPGIYKAQAWIEGQMIREYPFRVVFEAV